jgi:hypothetical protein
MRCYFYSRHGCWKSRCWIFVKIDSVDDDPSASTVKGQKSTICHLPRLLTDTGTTDDSIVATTEKMKAHTEINAIVSKECIDLVSNE